MTSSPINVVVEITTYCVFDGWVVACVPTTPINLDTLEHNAPCPCCSIFTH